MGQTLNRDQAIDLAVKNFKLKKFARSEKICRKIIEKFPNNPKANHILGASLLKQKKIDDAGPFLARAVKTSGGAKLFLNTYGVWLTRASRSDEAMAIFEKILEQDPQFSPTYTNIGLVHQRASDFEAAERAHRKALEINPDYCAAIHNLGNTLRSQKRLEESEACLNRALELRPDDNEIRLDRAICLLLAGKYHEAWPDYEARKLSYPERARHNALTIPYWEGEDFAGKRLLIYNEQGFGDLIQCARFFPMVKARGGEVTFAGPDPMHRLFEVADGIDRIEKDNNKLNGFDLRVPIFSLPHIFDVAYDDIPNKVPYLSFDPEVDGALVAAAEGRRAVGLCWAGNADNKLDADRTLPSRFLEDIVAVPGCDFYSLQFGERATDLEAHEWAGKITVLDDDRLGDFYQTAGIIKHLDLVITVDTVICHLAGALGVPTYLLVGANSDWRWGARQTTTPWYPSLTMFRQERPREWQPVVAAVRAKLQAG